MLELPVFSRLEDAMQDVCMSTLRVLQQRFWRADHVELFLAALLLVQRAGWGKHVINGAPRMGAVSTNQRRSRRG